LKRKEYNIDDRGEANYISTVVYILVVVITLALIMDVLAVIMTKQKLDTAADQVTRQVQLSGKVDEDTEALLEFLSTNLGKVDSLTISVDTSYITKEGCSTAIQLGTITDLDEEQVLTVESSATNVAGMIAVGIAVIVLIVILILVFGRKKPQQNRF